MKAVNSKIGDEKMSGGQGSKCGGSASGKRAASGGEEKETGGSANGKRSRSEADSAPERDSNWVPTTIKEIWRSHARVRRMEELAEQIRKAGSHEENPAEPLVRLWTRGIDSRWSNAHGNIKKIRKHWKALHENHHEVFKKNINATGMDRTDPLGRRKVPKAFDPITNHLNKTGDTGNDRWEKKGWKKWMENRDARKEIRYGT